MRINEKTCVLCGTCVGACPADAIVIELDSIRIEDGGCVLCGACADVCPIGAIAAE